jgi:hypothetical protein
LAKKQERLLGAKMKKFVIMLLVISILGLTSCGLLEKVGIGNPDGTTEICEMVKQSTPTQVNTDVNYLTNSGDKLTGFYETVTDGTNVIFKYDYQRFATPAESVESGNSDRILAFEGVINFKDGVYFGDEEEWKPGSGTAFDIAFNIDSSLLKEEVVNEDGNILDAKIAQENIAEFIGTNLNAVGDATVSITTNGVNLTAISISCATANGTVTIRTSYTYNNQELFPQVEEEETEGTEGEEKAE